MKQLERIKQFFGEKAEDLLVDYLFNDKIPANNQTLVVTMEFTPIELLALREELEAEGCVPKLRKH